MTRTVVWTEHEAGGWKDCTYCAVLMVLVYGGWRNFPEGIYTDAERELLERSDSVLDEQGANFIATDEAIRFRYGVELHRLEDGSEAGLRVALSTPGRAYAVAGLNARLPIQFRRWDPTFVGPHAMTIVPLGNGKVLVLNPQAPAGHEGDIADVETIIHWAFIPNDARYLAEDELTNDPFNSPKPPSADPLGERVLELRAMFPDYVRGWQTTTGMVPNYTGPTHQWMRVNAEVLYLRAMHPETAAAWHAATGLYPGYSGDLQRTSRLTAEKMQLELLIK